MDGRGREEEELMGDPMTGYFYCLPCMHECVETTAEDNVEYVLSVLLNYGRASESGRLTVRLIRSLNLDPAGCNRAARGLRECPALPVLMAMTISQSASAVADFIARTSFTTA